MKSSRRIFHALLWSALWCGLLATPRLAWASGMENAGGMIFVIIFCVLVGYPLCAIAPVSAIASVYMLIKYRKATPWPESGVWARRFGTIDIAAAVIGTIGGLALYSDDSFILMVLVPTGIILGFLGFLTLNIAKRVDPEAAAAL